MQPTTSLRIPQPCHESWSAMTPTAAGRHCAACAKTVVDFTLKTDAEILAYLAGAANDRTCGRFAAGQLDRPLQRAAPVAPAGRWRAWLAAAIAVWAVRESTASGAKAQTATEWRARYWGGPTPAAPVVAPPMMGAPIVRHNAVSPAAHPTIITIGMVSSQPRTSVVVPLPARPLVLQGIITDSVTGEGLPGVTVVLKGTTTGISTAPDGSYELVVPTELVNAPMLTINVSSVGFVTQERTLGMRSASEAQSFKLQADVKGMLTGEVVVCQLAPGKLPPAPWRPHAFYRWGKYWLTRPFRRY
jgi:hypothetical protein